jgi:voltage-gated potassium channel
MSERTSWYTPAAVWRRMGLARHNWPGRFTVLLMTILTFLVAQPIFSGHTFAENLVSLWISIVLLAALYAFRSARIYFVIALVLLVPSLGGRIALLFTSNPAIENVSAISSCLFLAVTVIALISRLFIVKSVTLDTISAGICAYLLTAVAFAYSFAVVELRHPGSFSTELFERTAGHGAPLLASFHNFLYYSFVCLTTTGFGDIAPVSGGARSLSVMESVFGQLYVAILIARLVSLQVAQSMMKERD